MGLMMSVLVFSIGVLEALACVEHVRQSYLPLDLGRKRRRLVLDVGSGTIRHRETRRSSEFQRDPHVFLRSIQAAVEEEGDEKESEELAAIFQAVEARNIHSTQIMNHQDPVFLSVNDIDESDSCASSEISRTSTPNTVIMNMSPGLDRGSVVESPYIPSDSFSELLGPEIDEVFSNQKDIGITKVDIEKFMCIREPDKQFESIDSNSPNIGEVLQSSNTQIVSKNSTVYTITNELLETKKTEINKGKSIDSTTDLLDTDIISIPVAESGIEKSTKDSLFTNSVLCDGHNTKIIMKNNELTCKSDKIGSNFDHPVIKDGEENTNNNIIISNTINFETQTATLKLPDNNKLSLLPNNTSVHNNGIVIQENDLEINHKINENSFNLSYIAETNNIETIEKCEILVKSQAHSGKEPLIENKGKDEICETQLERVIESEKQSKNDEIQNAQTVLTNSINIVHHTNNYEYDRKKINGADQLNSLSEHENSAIVPKHENEPIQEVLLQAQLNESEMVSIKLDESKDKIIEEAIAGTIDNDESCRRIPDQSATISNSDKSIAGSTNNDLDVCELQVAHNGQFDASGPIPTKPDVSNEFNKTIDHGMVKQDKDKETSSCIKVQTCNSLDSVNVCIDNNSNIAKETFSSDPGERKTIPTNGQANELIEAPHTLTTIEHVLVSKGDSILDSSCPKDKVISVQQELLSEDIVPTDSKSIIVEKEDKYLTNDVFRENVVEERSESNKVEIKEANVNAHHKPESIREVSKSEKIFDEAKHSTNISIDTTNIKEEVYSEKADSVKSEIVEECVRHLVDVVSEQQTSDCKSDYNNHIDTHRQCDSEGTVVTKEEFKPSVQTIPTGIALNEEHQVDSLKEVCAEIIVSKDTKSKGVDTDTIYPINNNVSNESGNQEELIMSENAAANEDDATKKLRPVAPQTSRLKIETESKEGITSKDILDVKESLKPLPQKEPAKDKGGKPSDRKAVKTDKGVLAKQETLNVSPFPDDVTLLVGDLPSQNQFTAVEDITSPDKAFWLIFSGEYTKAMSKDWHSGHFCCWQCDESLTGQRYVLRDDHPYCIKCYEQVFANTCDECSKVIGIDSKDLSYKDKHWHEACFLCSKCRVSLVDKQFGSKADKIYCGNCYDAQFASRCDGCGQIFRAGTKKMEYKTRQWHEQCFCCCVCKTAIGTKSFIPREQEIYCATCYEEKFATRCVKCNKIITSGGVTYKNEPWHRECFTCTNCSTSLAGQRFTSRDEKPYCAECFGELFAKRCTACCKPITGIGGTRFISFEDRHWHNDCFICASCRSSLVGRGFITDAEDILCTECAKQKLM